MGYKTSEERNAKKENSYGYENKQNGFMEDRAKIQKRW